MQTAKFGDVGVDRPVFDLLLSYDRSYDSIRLLGEQVIPKLH